MIFQNLVKKNIVRFKWTLDNGTVLTGNMEVLDGEDGDTGNGIQSITKTGTSGLVDTYTITFTDGNTDTFTVTNGEKGDPGENAQFDTMPTASSENVGQIVQYVGETTEDFINGYFYKCVEESGVYSWVNKNVQTGGSGGTSDYTELSNKPQIAGTTLVGDKSLSDLGIASATALADKVDKVAGKGLSANDYTNEDKAIVGGVTAALADKVDKVTGKGLSTEDYTSEEKTKLAGIEADAEVNTIESITLNGTEVTPDANKNVALTVITNAVNDLVNYYLKSETYTKTEVDTIASNIKNSRFEAVATLPTTDIKTNVIYLVPSTDPKTSNVKDEYINLDGTSAGWEKIGSTDIDLSNYVTTTDLATALADYTTTTDLNTLLAAKADKSTVDGILDGSSIDSFGDVETALADKADISDVPTKTSDLTNDSNFVPIFTGTQAEWDAVVDKSVYEIVNITDDSETGTTTNQVTDGDVRAVSSGAVYDALTLKADKTAITNPNLLDNPWFTVNQRGQSSYSGPNYAVDRWEVLNNKGTVTVNADGSITVTASGGDTWLRQKFEPELLKKLVGKPITVNIDAVKTGGNVNLYSGYYDASNTWHRISEDVGVQTSRTIVSRTAIVPTLEGGEPKFGEFGIYIQSGQSVTIHSTKLELGSVSTLAMDTVPNYATELLKCQRYFYKTMITIKSDSQTTSKLSVATNTNFLTGVDFPVQMRDIPTYSNVKAQDFFGTTLIDGIVFETSTKDGVCRFYKQNAFTQDTWYYMQFEASADL